MSDEKPAYWWEFLKHPRNQAVALGMSGLAVVLSFPFGAPGAVLVLLGLMAVETVGLATVPALEKFRTAVDRKAARVETDAMRARLLAEIEQQGGSDHVADYRLMCDRVESLYRTAVDRASTLTERDVESLDQLTITYLRMCLSDAVLKQRDGLSITATVQRKLKDVEQRLAQDVLAADERQQLERAWNEYRESLARQTRMASRRSALEASLVSMPLRMEEVHQMVMTSPAAGDLRSLLDESVSKLRIAEDVANDVDDVLAAPRKNPSTEGRKAPWQTMQS